MLITRRPDGSLLVEVRADQFSKEWRTTPQSRRVVLPDKRPAILKLDEAGVPTYTTVMGHAWEVMRVLARDRATLKGKTNCTKLCEQCSYELKLVWEEHRHWIFECPACKSREIHSKDMIGGQIGAGTKESIPSGQRHL